MVNYPEPDVRYTRIAEYKHTPNQPLSGRNSPGTVIYREYSTDVGDPYYPVPNPENQALYAKYQRLAEEEEGVVFVGRLASYKYFNMDQAILTALELYDNLEAEGKLPSWYFKWPKWNMKFRGWSVLYHFIIYYALTRPIKSKHFH